MRIAHPLDLLASGRWPSYQQALFTERRKQPFRQVFRELYVPVPGEGPESPRYAGQQVEVRKAHALLRGRGWVFDWDAGFGRTFHRQGWTAWCTGEDLQPGLGVEDATIGTVHFARAGAWEPAPLAEAGLTQQGRPRLTVDIDASGSTPDECATETTRSKSRITSLNSRPGRLLGIDSVEVEDRFAHVTGSLGSYRVHLGSGVVHREPGGSVFLVPVAAQHRGRSSSPSPTTTRAPRRWSARCCCWRATPRSGTPTSARSSPEAAGTGSEPSGVVGRVVLQGVRSSARSPE